jgi:hypothetical protein
MRRWAGTGPVVIAAFMIAGCGGGGHAHSHSTTTAANSFAARADAVCQTANAQIRQLAAPASTPAGVTRYAGELLPIARTMTTKLGAIDPPGASKAEYARFLAVLRSDVAELRRVHAGSLTAQQLAAAARAIDARGGAQDAQQLGLSACQQTPKPKGA